MTHWADDAGHVWVVGRTQTGKTTTAKEMFAESQRVNIWLNERGDDRVEGISRLADGSYRSLDGVKNAFARDEYRIEFLPADRDAGVQRLQAWLWGVAKATDRQLPVTVYADEIHRLAPQTQKNELGGRDAVRKIAKEGKKRNVKLVGISQDPVSFDKQALRQRDYLLCYELAHEQADYLAQYGADVREINSQPEYAGVLYHADGSTHASGVKAQARYA